MAFFDPTGWLTAIEDVALLLTKMLPSDELQLARFKLRSPAKYAKIQKHMLNGFVAYCKKHFGGNYQITYGTVLADDAVRDYVTLETDDLCQNEQILFVELTLAEYRA